MSDIVVSNTTPLITLLSIGKLDLLKRLYRKIYIPQAVFQEMEKGKHRDAYIDLKQQNWIEIREIKDEFAFLSLIEIVDKGEAEAIILYQEMSANLLLIDERMGRQQAQLRNCKITGTAGILIAAKQMGFLNKIKPLLIQARDNGMRISEELFFFYIKRTRRVVITYLKLYKTTC